MNLHAVGWLLGCVLLLLAAFLLVPAGVGFHYGEAEAWACVHTAVVTALAGGGLVWLYRGSTITPEGKADYFRREGLAVVGLSWLLAGAVGALPYLFSGVLTSPVDAFFESVSGFTTTGSTILSAVQLDGDPSIGMDPLPRAIAFWRSFTHWLGGVGIVVVFVVLFPTGGRSLFRSEVPGISREAGHQRVRDSALSLVRIYVGLTLIQGVLLWLSGLSPFDAAIHSFGTLATGGFSNHSASIAHFGSWLVELNIIVFMFLAGINFAIYDATLRVGPRKGWRMAIGSAEVRWYCTMMVGAAGLIGLVLWFWGGSNGAPDSDLPDYGHFGRSMRDSAFNAVALQTSTGYGTADFDRWPPICRMLLMFLAFVGACAGSTGGGLKMVRFMIVAKAALRGIRRFARPRAIHSLRIDGQTLDEGVVASVTGFFGLWIIVAVLGTLCVAASGVDPVSSATSVLATLNNIGPGLARVGPSMNFGELADPIKLLLSLFMILGRLEFYAVVVLFVPGFWRR